MAIVTGKNQRWRVLGAHAFLIALLVVTLFPLAAVVSISLRPGNFAGGSLIPHSLTLAHWKLALGISVTGPDGKLEAPPFPVLQWIANSMKVALVSAAVALLLSITAAYAFARMRFRGKRLTLDALLLLQMFPSVLALVAIYALFDRIGEWVPWLGLNSHWSLVLAYSGGIAQYVWLIKGYFESLPDRFGQQRFGFPWTGGAPEQPILRWASVKLLLPWKWRIEPGGPWPRFNFRLLRR